jgi:hypothetical protein
MGDGKEMIIIMRDFLNYAWSFICPLLGLLALALIVYELILRGGEPSDSHKL